MRRLFLSEWQRLWGRKVTWLSFAAVPIMVLAAASYLQKANEQTEPNLPQYSVFGNFSVLSFEEMLLTAFNLFVIMFTAFIVTDEYREGQLRMVMQRAYTFAQLFWAKTTIVLLTVLMLVAFYFVASLVVGSWMFPHTNDIPLFYYRQTVDVWGALRYSLAFYTLGFLCLVAMTGVMMFIAVISRTTTVAIGTGVGFYLLSFMYPFVSGYFIPLIGEETYMKVMLSSIPMIEWQGLVLALAETPQYSGWIFGTLLCYTAVFGGLAYLIFSRQDRWV